MDRMKKNHEERQPMPPEQKRMYIIAAVFTLICAAIVAGLLWFLREDDESEQRTPTTPTSPVSAEDQAQIGKVVEGFVANAGRWGLKDEVFTPENAISVFSAVSSNSRLAVNYWDSRSAVYPNVAEGYLANPSPLRHSTDQYVYWDEQLEKSLLASFRATTANVSVPSTQTMISYQSTVVPQVDVPFTLVSELTRRTQTVNDSSWDGTFEIQKGTFREDMVASVVKVDGEWKMYSLRGPRPYLLTTWGDPDQVDESYFEALNNTPQPSETLKAELPNE